MRLTNPQKKELQALLRQLIILRDGERCLWCGGTQKLQMSHIFPKGKHRRMEFEPENLKLLCFSCHFHRWHKSPLEAWEWLTTVLDPDRLKRLRLRANSVDKSPFDFKLYKLYLEDQIRKLSPVKP
jgi:5-methylcytosine-specific restriction endonuclease McrA